MTNTIAAAVTPKIRPAPADAARASRPGKVNSRKIAR